MNADLDIAIFPRRRVRRVTQTTIAECGLACLAMVASFHNLDVDLSTLRQTFKPSTRGITLRALMRMADQMGLSSRAVQLDLHEFAALTTPAILHWDLAHFVVLERVEKERFLIHDPGGSTKWIAPAELSKHFTGVALELAPTKGVFEPGDFRQALKLRDLWSNINGTSQAVTQVVILSVLVQFFALSGPYFIQLAFDLALPNKDETFLWILATCFAGAVGLSGATVYLRATVLLSLGSLFASAISSNVARKTFRLPIEWFARRHVGDILSRFQSIGPIRKILAEDLPAVIVDGTLAIMTLIVMGFYSLPLFFISLFGFLILVTSKGFLFRAEKSAQEEMLIANGREQSVLIETLRGIRPLRLSGQEAIRHALWRSRMIEAVNYTIKYNQYGNIFKSLQFTSLGIENIVTVAVSVVLVINDKMTLGMIFAFFAYKSIFLISSGATLERLYEFKLVSLHLERLADIVLTDDDIAFHAPTSPPAVCEGRIELRAIRYRYGSSEPYVLDGVDLVAHPGETVAITGPSGGGKTTLANIILGLIEPQDGELLIDGRNIRAFGHANYYRQVAAVLQDDTLFAGSLSDNITMFDDLPDMDKLVSACEAAAIYEDIRRMPMGFNTLVGDMGSALSGGQQQRVMLARALYRNPKILVLDEATAHLDGDTEGHVNDAIRALGITRILIAHRRSTIEMADRTYVLKDGSIYHA